LPSSNLLILNSGYIENNLYLAAVPPFLDIIRLNFSTKKELSKKIERSLDIPVPDQPNPFLNITDWRNNH